MVGCVLLYHLSKLCTHGYVKLQFVVFLPNGYKMALCNLFPSHIEADPLKGYEPGVSWAG